MISWLSTAAGWGTREQAIPGEWALLLLLIVLGALLGLIVLWFTLLRHERTLERRGRRRDPRPEPRGGIALLDIGPAAEQAAQPAEPREQEEREAPRQPVATGADARRKLP